MDNYWICSGCKSMNRPGADKCYSCRAPRAVATSASYEALAKTTATGSTSTPTAEAGAAPAAAFVRTGNMAAPLWVPGSGPVPDAVREFFAGYRSSGPLAMLAIVFIAVAAVGSIASLFQTFDLLRPDVPGASRAYVAGILRVMGSPLMLWYVAYGVVSILAAVFFLLWLRRSMKNVPALGGGWPSWSGLGLIVWWIIPIACYFKPAQFVEDLRRRVAVADSAGPGLLAAWWGTWVGAQLVPFIAGFFGGFFVRDVADLLRLQLFLSVIGTTLYSLAAFFVVLLIRDIERSQAVRAAIIGGGDPTAPTQHPRPAVVPQFVVGLVILVAAAAMGVFLTRADDVAAAPAPTTSVPVEWRTAVCGAVTEMRALETTLDDLTASAKKRDLSEIGVRVQTGNAIMTRAATAIALAPEWSDGETVRAYVADTVATGRKAFQLYDKMLRTRNRTAGIQGDQQLNSYIRKWTALDAAMLPLTLSHGPVCA